MPVKSSLFALSLTAAALATIWTVTNDIDLLGSRQQERDPFATPDRRVLTSGFKFTGRAAPITADEELPQVGQLSKQTISVETAQVTTTVSDEQTTTPVAEKTSARATVDESALRYFASRGDAVRLQTEISRLRALYPDWVPPKDPLVVPQNEDTQLEVMWMLYSEGRYPDVRKAIADRQTAEAGWRPPADLLDRLAIAEARANLLQASDSKQYAEVIRIASETTSLLTCSEVDVLWRVAEAFAQTQRLPRARDAYLYGLNNCEKPAERLATVQKAASLLPYAMMDELLSRERKTPGGSMEFESIRDDLARRFVGDGNSDAALVVAPQYLERVEKVAESGGRAADSLLLGWYKLRRNDMTAAEKWFRRAREREDSASASQGLALTLIARKSPQEAEDVMYRWRNESAEAKATYFAATANLMAIMPPIVLSPEILQRVAKATTEARDAPTGQQFGWYARALRQYKTAADWFATVQQWKPDDEPSAYGLAITLQQLRDRAGVRAIQQRWAVRSERIATLGETRTTRETGSLAYDTDQRTILPKTDRVVGDDLAGAQASSRRVRRSPVDDDGGATERVASHPARCSTTIDPQALAPAVALARGWCLMEMSRPVEAAAAFEVAMSGGSVKTREDAAYGQSLAYLRVGLT